VAMWSVGGCRQLRLPHCWFQLRSMDRKSARKRSAVKQYAFLRIKPAFLTFFTLGLVRGNGWTRASGVGRLPQHYFSPQRVARLCPSRAPRS
jgi:hypothetical protein